MVKAIAVSFSCLVFIHLQLVVKQTQHIFWKALCWPACTFDTVQEMKENIPYNVVCCKLFF